MERLERHLCAGLTDGLGPNGTNRGAWQQPSTEINQDLGLLCQMEQAKQESMQIWCEGRVVRLPGLHNMKEGL